MKKLNFVITIRYKIMAFRMALFQRGGSGKEHFSQKLKLRWPLTMDKLEPLTNFKICNMFFKEPSCF